ncbi:MAG TPA: amino acid permease [Anaerolineae bacterium]|nr:amino acid permease [Anaerolineae bacterium]
MTNVKEDLRRELGFWAALTIGAGTMIGAGIFLLSGVAISLVGPGAIIAYIIAGIVCIITAASAAELATGMPTSGGDYFFVSRSLGPAFGAISGIGIWLSLTFAIAFYLVGMGEYLNEFLPIIPPIVGAAGGGILFIWLNVVGAKESGRTQVIVVLTLLVILGIYTVAGAFNMEASNLSPFLPNGYGPISGTTALVFVSFLGFVKIAAVSEEIQEPSKNLPRALIGSVVLVTVMYILIVLVTAGMFPQAEIQAIVDDKRSPLTVAALDMFGPIGAGVMIFAGLLATLSSANASIMAASRINLAMARDRMIPQWLNEIHPKNLTPYRAILVTGGVSLLLLGINQLDTLAKIASVLQLYSYAALNIGCIILRVADPDWYKPSYRMPGTPYLQVIAACGCFGIILASGLLAQIIIALLIGVSLAWYMFWSRPRVEIEYALGLFREKVATHGWSVLFRPAVAYVPEADEASAAGVRLVEANRPRRVMTALANPQHEADLLKLGRYLATGREKSGEVWGIHLVNVPIQTPLNSAREGFAEHPSLARAINIVARKTVPEDVVNGYGAVLSKTSITPIIDVAHDVFGSLMSETSKNQADLLLMGWRGGLNVSQIYNSPMQRIITQTPADVAVLKNRGLGIVDSILIPWGGGPHAQLGLELVLRIARLTGATIHLLRIVKPNVNQQKAQEILAESVAPLVGDYPAVNYQVVAGENIIDTLIKVLDVGNYDLVVIGASHEWRIRNVLFGSIPDVVADYAQCSVLMVRQYLAEH